MPLDKVDKFLENVLSYIKFPFVKDDIRFELEGHILDRINFYIEQGYDSDKAEELSIKDMGDPKEIGILLNKQHNPFLGWVLRITNGMVVLFITLGALFIIPIFGVSLFSKSPIKDIPKGDIVYKIDVDEKVKIDDTVIRFTNVVYDKNGDMNIFYEYYDTSFWGQDGV